MSFRVSILIFSAFSLAGCASATRGTQEEVTILSIPADATITTSLGHRCSESPCVVKVPRKKTFTATAEKPGYNSATQEVLTRVSGKGGAGLAGNLLLGGVVGIGIDAATGASLDHYPNPVKLHLTPIAGS